jgi:hypothetical protein
LQRHQERFVHRGEEEPVVEGRLDFALGDECFGESLPGLCVELLQELLGARRRASAKGRVDEGREDRRAMVGEAGSGLMICQGAVG